MDYSDYRYTDLLNDDFFLDSIAHPTAESELFWQEQALANDRLAEEMERAREIVILASHRGYGITPEVKDALYERICHTIENTPLSTTQRQGSFRPAIISIAASVLVLIAGSFLLLNYLNVLKRNRVTEVAAGVSVGALPMDTARAIRLVKPDGAVMLAGDAPDIRYNDRGELEVNAERVADGGAGEAAAEVAQHRLIVPYARRSFLTLSDGSKIWVNANTCLEYPAVFEGDVREVFVDGEIYLEVAPDARRPFVVKTRDMEIQVLGTSFNVSAYGKHSHSSVVLVSGKVNVSAGQQRGSAELRPGEIARITPEGMERGVVDVENYVSWRRGTYVFGKERFSAVLDKLSDYYGRELRLAPDSEDFHCSGTLNLKDDLQKLLQGLERAYSIVCAEGDDGRIEVSVKKKYLPMTEE